MTKKRLKGDVVRGEPMFDNGGQERATAKSGYTNNGTSTNKEKNPKT
jgi:hypothetical protein